MGAATVNKGKQKAKGSKKGRKYDRHRKRSPSADRYRAEGRDKTNKIKNLVQAVRNGDNQALALVTQLIKLHPMNAKLARRQLTKQDTIVKELFI